MNELLPYEEQLAGKLAEIPLPGEDRGWDAMQAMLDADDDGGIVPPPPPNAGCRNRGMVALLLLLLLAGVTAGVYKMVTGKAGSPSTDNSVPANKPFAPLAGDSSMAGLAHKKTDLPTQQTSLDSPKATANNIDTVTIPPVSAASTGKVAAKSLSGVDVKKAGLSENADASTFVGKKGVFALRTKGSTFSKRNDRKDHETKDSSQPNKTDSLAGARLSVRLVSPKKEDAKETDDDSLIKLGITIPGGTVKTGKDSAAFASPKVSFEESGGTKAAVEISNNKMVDVMITNNQIYFSGGLGLQQLIPIDGQKANPYNAFGRKGSLADYIPSVYFRVHRKRAFLQAEFKYGAPQYTKDIAYNTKVLNFDSATRITNSSVNHVNKTYYHQLPISLHYSILPNFSIGAGVVWNRFQSAVVTQENHAVNGITGTDSVLSTKVINVKSDSAFSKTYWQCMLEAQYSWRRFSLGARYAWGLTPYLSYTSPTTGQTQKERNASLNIFLRYELWQPKRK